MGATGLRHLPYHERGLVFWHTFFNSKQAKQNSILHLGHIIFLQAAPLCSISLPHVGHALMLGISGRLEQLLNLMNLQLARITKSF